MAHNPSRRFILKGAAACAAGIAGGRLLTSPRLARAAEGDEKSAVLLLFTQGGYNAFITSANSFVGNGAFGVTSTNVRRIGQSPLYVDRNILGSMTAPARQHMAGIGVRHGYSGHPAAQQALWMNNNKSYPIQLARAMGGSAAMKFAVIGRNNIPGEHRAIGDVSMQRVRDLRATIAALGGTVDADSPEREIAGAGMEAARAMSEARLAANPRSAVSLAESYPVATNQLTADAQTFDFAEIAQAYGVQPNMSGAYPTVINGAARTFMGAELLIRAGTNVVAAVSRGWDTHGDRNGSRVRNKWRDTGMTDALRVFLDRTLNMPGYNVVTMIFGDFARSLPRSDHQPNLTATVIGKYVKLGTTGRVNRNVGLPSGTPGIQGMWSYLSAALKTQDKPFGNNPHGLILG